MLKPRLSLALPLAAIFLSGCIVVPRGYGGHGHHGRGHHLQQSAPESVHVQPAPRGHGRYHRR